MEIIKIVCHKRYPEDAISNLVAVLSAIHTGERVPRHSHAWSGTAGLAWRSVLGKHPGVRPMSRLCLRTSRHPPRAEAPGFSRGVYDSPSV